VHHNTEVTNADIGRFCSIAPGCRIGLGKHPSRIFVSTHPAFYAVAGGYPFSFVNRQKFEQRKRIIIGNDVWISANVLIADGVTIGNGAIIGAGAVVVKSIPDYAIFGGVPARLIRYRFTQEEISWLNRFRWWDKDEQWLRAHSEAFQDI
jgi:acetyltransferase-like isoleucine patch superfamily enzyme